MGAFPELLGGPADAGRAVVASDRAYGLGPPGFHPCRLRADGAARSACPSPVTAGRSRAARPVGFAKGLYGLATASPSRERGAGPLVRLAAHGGPRRGAGNRFRGRSPFLDCPSEPPIAAQSLDGGGLRPATMKPSPAPCHASRPAIRHKAAPCGRFLLRSPESPGCHAPLLQPETPPSPFGTLPARRFVRRLRRAEPSRKGEQA